MSTILIIEDNLMNLEIAYELLKNADFNVLKTECVKNGINIAKSEIPDLILMDLSLPEIDGLSATRILKQNSLTKNIPIIAFTASVMQGDKEKALSAGCSGFISKPIDVAKFASKVKSYLNISSKDISSTNLSKQFLNTNNKYLSEYSENESEIDNFKDKYGKILIIEDNSMNAEILKESLYQIGKNSIVVNNGKDALEIVKKYNFDLILLDVMMPEMSGFEVIKQLKLSPETSKIPVIFVSALAETDHIVKGLDLGSYDYITKPYNIKELKAKVLNILRIKELQNQLISEKRKFDSIFKFSTDGIVLLSSKLEIVSCNSQFIKWINISKEKIIGKKFCDLIKCENNQDCLVLKQYNKSENDYICREFALEVEKKLIFIDVKVSKINENKTKTGTNGYVLTLRDVTAFKEIEKQKETFVATLTHDLKTPIRAEIRAMELLLKGNFGSLNEEQVSIIKDTLCSSKYMFNMVDNLLCTYKNEAGNIVLQKENININELIISCGSELKHLIEDKKQQLQFNFKKEKLIAFIDLIEIKRVIINLLSNAINYSYENDDITISSDIVDNQIIISVKDNGKGLSESDLKTLFNKYNSFAKKFRQVGTGLGLYLSKQIIEAHNGKIWAESEEGKGSIFTFSLPL